MNKLEKEAMTYEVTEENKQRRRAIPAKDKRDTERSASRANRSRAVRNNPIVKAIRSNMLILTFLTSVWFSGFLAAKGEAFWSLLLIVLGTLLIVGAMWVKITNIESEE